MTKSTTARATPSESGSSRGQAVKGDTYAVSRVQGEWVEVQFSEQKAWLKKADVAVKEGELKRTKVALNVRSGAGTSFAVLGTLPAGTRVAERGGNGTWRKISFKGKTGYVFGAFLGAVPSSSSSSSASDGGGSPSGGSGSNGGATSNGGSGSNGGAASSGGSGSNGGAASSGGSGSNGGSSSASNTGTSTSDASTAASGQNRTAVFQSTSKAGQRNQMKTGTITINNNAYRFRTGGFGKGNLPPGSYTITPHLWSRSDPSMNVQGVGWSFAMSDKYDPRVGATRTLLRIHPDGGSPGTEGCVGIVGDGATMRRFKEDMRAEFARSGNRFTLVVR